MSLLENAILNQVRRNLNKKLNLDDIREIYADGIKEHRDIPYKNRTGKELLMIIWNRRFAEPAVLLYNDADRSRIDAVYRRKGMKRLKIDETCDSFRQIRNNGSYYVDKTYFLCDYFGAEQKKAIMLTRPRRFGKTVLITMLRDFLDVRMDSRELFEGLRIMEHTDIVEKYMNKYPVVFMSLKEVYGKTETEISGALGSYLSENLAIYDKVFESPDISKADKERFMELRSGKAEKQDVLMAPAFLCRVFAGIYGKPTYVLIDEYDVPMARTAGTEAYDPTRNMIEKMLSNVCKTNENVAGVVLTGCLYTVKNSTYTGVNNIRPYTVMSDTFSTAIGFTEEEVKKLLEDGEISDCLPQVQEWYNGYIFGQEHIYCPWDVLSHVDSVLKGEYKDSKGPENYWLATSESRLNLIRGFFGKTTDATEQFEYLLAGGSIRKAVDESLTYDRIYEQGDNLWSALLETGYVTKASKEEEKDQLLRIPNREVLEVFRKEVHAFFDGKIENSCVKEFVNALWAEETDRAEETLNLILEATLSFYHEYHEYSYHLILDGFFTGQNYLVLSELESGYGRTDLIVKDYARRRCLLIELKHAKNIEELDKMCREAGSQILTDKYDSRLKYEGYSDIKRYGMAFSDKRCRIGRI